MRHCTPAWVTRAKLSLKKIKKIKGIHDRPIVSKVQDREKLKAFPIRSGTQQGSLLSALLFNMVLEVLARAFRQEIKIKGH